MVKAEVSLLFPTFYNLKMRMYKQMRMYKPSDVTSINKCLSVKVCLLLNPVILETF